MLFVVVIVVVSVVVNIAVVVAVSVCGRCHLDVAVSMLPRALQQHIFHLEVPVHDTVKVRR